MCEPDKTFFTAQGWVLDPAEKIAVANCVPLAALLAEKRPEHSGRAVRFGSQLYQVSSC